ncbi:M48 family metalloprotease [Amycolatopsis benzoatilytica]|uniref:M48 family metalloprotease n=1 Tax=Amycolatopsis benzoatilytica TaxID=346045 RepID=UPI00068782E6|nr:M48 family metalloprotease [Amycolatopsis benzoatilytica]
MRVDVYLALFLPVLAARGVPMAGRRLAPPAAVRLLCGVAVAVGAGTLWGLVMVAGAGLSHLGEVLEHSPLSAAQLRRLDPVPRIAGTVAAVLLVVIAVRVARVVYQRARLRKLMRGVVAGARGELVVFADPSPHAYAVSPGRGRPGRIVVSDGMLQALGPDERRVLLAHERAHLVHQHHRYQAVAAVAAAVNPVLVCLRGQIAFQLERWADEDAATAVASRELAARSLARAALATVGSGAALAFSDRGVRGRVSALRRAPTVTRPLSLLPTLVVLGGGLAVLADATIAFLRVADALLG